MQPDEDPMDSYYYTRRLLEPRFKKAVHRVLLALSSRSFQRHTDIYQRAAESSRPLPNVPEEGAGIPPHPHLNLVRLFLM